MTGLKTGSAHVVVGVTRVSVVARSELTYELEIWVGMKGAVEVAHLSEAVGTGDHRARQLKTC